MKRASCSPRSASFDSTYEGLKHGFGAAEPCHSESFDSTYEGLKRLRIQRLHAIPLVFRQYL